MLVLAQTEAERAGHTYVGTEHMLLGLLASHTEAATILRQLGVEDAPVRVAIEHALGGNRPVVPGQIIPTSRVKKAMELAVAAADREGSEPVTPEHLLVGLLEEGEGVAVHVLGDLGVTLQAVAAIRDG